MASTGRWVASTSSGDVGRIVSLGILVVSWASNGTMCEQTEDCEPLDELHIDGSGLLAKASCLLL